ncbi:unnamed protein product [Owenia fusiformis]|uniref:Uncharacterized protein n=1 Tax=Owenia fusiformis TaxID=6347 RepID=A0A8J1UZN3_OWEFU|nr:unnamed protein product [Owenia fusiformis]
MAANDIDAIASSSDIVFSDSQSSTSSLQPAQGSDSLYTETAQGSLDAQYQAADSNSPKQAFVPCKVCGDKASGYHYGVTSCEGCKGFFRRSIQKQIEYRCLRDGKCLVIRLNRNRCQYCRFKKCLAVGMSRDSVRYGRVPKRSQSIDDSVTTSEATVAPAMTESRQLAIYDTILTISQAHHANCEITEEKIKVLQLKPVTLVVKRDIVDTVTSGLDMLEWRRISMWQGLAHLVTPTVQQVVEFAKRIPDFASLSQEDQLILIKSSFFEIWLARLARLVNPEKNTVTFGDGCVLPKEQLQIVYTPELVEVMFDFAQQFSQLQLNDTEIGLVTATILTTPERIGIRDTKAVEHIQDKVQEALKLQVSRNHLIEPNFFETVMSKLLELRALGNKHSEQLNWYRHRWDKLKLPPLLSEIYDIPKVDDEEDS